MSEESGERKVQRLHTQTLKESKLIREKQLQNLIIKIRESDSGRSSRAQQLKINFHTHTVKALENELLGIPVYWRTSAGDAEYWAALASTLEEKYAAGETADTPEGLIDYALRIAQSTIGEYGNLRLSERGNARVDEQKRQYRSLTRIEVGNMLTTSGFRQRQSESIRFLALAELYQEKKRTEQEIQEPR